MSSEHTWIENTKCPACQRRGLFVGTGGHITCSQDDCPNPDFDEALIAQLQVAKAEALTTLKQKFDDHAKSIGLWSARAAALDHLALAGKLSTAQAAEREAMVTERRALLVLHGTVDEMLAALTTPKEDKETE